MVEIETTIDQVEKLYEQVTGTRPPPLGATPYAPMPPEADPARHVEAQLDRLMEALAGISAPEATSAGPRADGMPTTDQPTWAPRIAVWEGPEELMFHVDLPGTSREALQVTVEGATLTVAGRNLPPTPRGDGAPLQARWVETPLGAFVRTIPLPADALVDTVQARLSDGVLEIRVPRRPIRAERRVVTIQ